MSNQNQSSVTSIKPKVYVEKTIPELEKEAMRYEYTMDKHMRLYFKDTHKNKDSLRIAVRCSKEANKVWKKIAFLERLKLKPF
jgi:hypothetical protein